MIRQTVWQELPKGNRNQKLQHQDAHLNPEFSVYSFFVIRMVKMEKGDLEQVFFEGFCHGAGAGVDVKLHVDVLLVGIDGVVTDK